VKRISAVSVANGDIVPISSHSPLLSSAKSGWDGIQVEHHCLPASECPELELQHHSITIILGQPFEIDWRLAGGHQQSTQMRTGDICITPARVSTQARWYKSVNFLLLSISPKLIERAVYESINTSSIEIAPKRGVHDSQILHIGSAFKAELETGCESGSLYGESLGLALAVHVLKRYSISKTVILEPSEGLQAQKLQQVIDYINYNLEATVTLKEIAAVAEMSPYYFARQFKLSTGLPPHQYVIQCRINRAKILLTENKLPIVEIAHCVGCSNQSNFTALFRKYLGITPKAYREQTRRC
jgi:AraC family transcriptional regulator